MMLQIELSDTSLQRELGAVRIPTLAAFSEKIEGLYGNRLAGQSLLPPMATLFLVKTLHLLHPVVILDNPAVQLITLLFFM